MPPPPDEDCARMCLYAADPSTSAASVVSPHSDALVELLSGGPQHYDHSHTTTYGLGTDTIIGSSGDLIDWSSGSSETSASAIDETEQAALGENVRDHHWVRVDTIVPVGTFDGVTMVQSFLGGNSLKSETEYVANGHHYGHSTCLSLGRCDETVQKIGSKCSKAGHGSGFCYQTAAGYLDCGRLYSTQKKMIFSANTEVLVTEADHSPVRCPFGHPADDGGSTGKKSTAKRMKLAGCKDPADPNYNRHFDVHVAQMCETPHHYNMGCMFPGAVNYVHGADEPGPCIYSTYGCTWANASNYNSRATHDDGSCIEKVEGCVLPTASYAGVSSDVKGYKSLYVAQPIRGDATVRYKDYKTALNSTADANWMTSCKLAIEGCMDPSAVNYDPKANSNTNTWCISVKTGCMMPSVDAGAPLDDDLHSTGGSATYNPDATVHVLSDCEVERRGCMNEEGLNYDEDANVNFGCYFEDYGCLDLAKPNYDDSKTMHLDSLCAAQAQPESFDNLVEEAGTRSVTINYKLVCAGEVSDYPAEVTDTMAEATADRAGISRQLVTVTVEAASVLVIISIEAGNGATAQAVSDQLELAFADKEAASAFFEEAGLEVEVISDPIIEVELGEDGSAVGYVPPGGIAGIAVGVVAIVVVVVGALYIRRKRKMKTTTVTPA
jgi:hypothetical protein